MKKRNKNSWILQFIREKDFARQVIRRKKQHQEKIQLHEPKRGLPVDRKFRRTNNDHYFRRQINHERKRNNFIKRKENYLKKFAPTNLAFLINCIDSPFYIESIKREKYQSNGIVQVPEIFSIIEAPLEAYKTFRKLISALLVENTKSVILDYQECIKVELGSQILLDIILRDYLSFARKCIQIDRNQKEYFPVKIGGCNIENEDVQKIIFSVGSPVTLKVKEHDFDDVIRYKLCIHDNEKEKDPDKRMQQKELDTTNMADYVIECLERMKLKLTSSKLDDLCTVIGEMLINAEEHSSTKYRFSIGYFKEENIDGKHFGIFRLVILNFGNTIYEKFKSEDCPNKEIKIKMRELSQSYTRRDLFYRRKFEEESLWTLYALQEGVTSVSPKEYKRGNGSIRFIESFFNIKGSQDADSVSNMTMISGNTKIVFDGTYNIQLKTNENNETFRVMTFNESGNIEDQPDSKFVFQEKEYFPGTLISAKILLNEDDLEQLKN